MVLLIARGEWYGADNPIASATLAEQKLTAITQAATILRDRYGL
ncbi:MAG: hypothetical protein OXC18_23600 [Desulfurellaceae bacterium]|nr:hypothetical protein [Desulfurellaceae bacterium]